jgi:hypothetical protein
MFALPVPVPSCIPFAILVALPVDVVPICHDFDPFGRSGATLIPSYGGPRHRAEKGEMPV